MHSLKPVNSLPKIYMVSRLLNDLLLNISVELEQNETFKNDVMVQLRKRDWRIVAKTEGRYFR